MAETSAASSCLGGEACPLNQAVSCRAGRHFLMERNRTPRNCGLLLQRMHTLLALGLSSAALGAQVLPPPSVRPDQAHKLPAETRLFVREYRFVGNTAFSAPEL